VTSTTKGPTAKEHFPWLDGSALAVLVGEVKLASNSRCTNQRDRIEVSLRTTEEPIRSAVDEVGRRPKIESARLAGLESRLDLLLLSAGSTRRFPRQPIAAKREPRPAGRGPGLFGLSFIAHHRQRHASGFRPQTTQLPVGV